MMDDLQQAYNAYQTALLHLPNPKVSYPVQRFSVSLLTRDKTLGAPAVVWHRHPL
jgi:hypothetical protein